MIIFASRACNSLKHPPARSWYK